MSDEPVVDTVTFEKTRDMLGTSFVRILGYFFEDGEKSVAEIEAAFHERSAARIVRPAHTLKTEARQFGALPLGELACDIEMRARRCVETQDAPDELLVQVAKLRPLFKATNEMLERETNPLQQRPKKFGVAPQGFGRAGVANQSFGRL